ncbi:MAG: hypothetical protein R3253_13615 [Longimicrobiales bacterium]|nr:hypothetical protein [Longimicrobiales bacterium]
MVETKCLRPGAEPRIGSRHHHRQRTVRRSEEDDVFQAEML